MRKALNVFLLSALLLSSTPVWGATVDSMSLTMKGPPAADLEAKQLYAVDITCRPTQMDLAKAVKKGFLISSTQTSSHVIVVSPTQPTKTGDKTTLPTAALFSDIVFSINAADRLDQRSCNDHFFVTGGRKYYLIVANNYSKTHEPGQAISFLKNGIKIAQPLFTLFGAGQLSAAVAPLLTAVTGVEAPYRDLLVELNKGDNFTKTIQLSPGKYQISTQYSVETVVVRPISSAVSDMNTTFTALFEQQVNDAKEKMQPPGSRATCGAILGDLRALGFYSPTDQGYALVQIALRGGLTKQEVLANCLPRGPAMAVARLKDFYWKGIPDESRITVQDVENVLGPDTVPTLSPPFSSIVPAVVSLIDAGNQVLRRDDVPPAALLATNSIFTEKASLLDHTNDVLFGNLDGALPVDILRLLKSKGVTRLGCYSETSGATDAASDGAPAILLGFMIHAQAKDAGADDAITIRPLFQTGKIAALSISRNRAWIESVLANRSACNEVKIKK
ncbi:hypothetical protein NKI36_14320 [Mesorhizobium caraganae]|uniref:Uncharacterized protein n=1 Tax=Mesorhizobium caraganae TaxID=483206 RepID=A0ABV1YZN7_9HYPH